MRIDSNGVQLEVGVQGEGPAVLFVHGWPDDHHLWDEQVTALTAAGYRTIAPDLRGFGASSRPDDVADYELAQLTGDLLGVLDQLAVERAHVVGHGFGAALSWILAALVPDRVDHLVALSVGHPAAFRSAGIAQHEKSWYVLLFQFVGVAEEWLSADGWARFREWSNHPQADAVIARFSRKGALTASLNLYRANASPDRLIAQPPELPLVKAPTMAVWSTDDMALTEAQMLASEAHVAGPWRYERLDRVGHWIPLEAPELLSALLLDFLPAPS